MVSTTFGCVTPSLWLSSWERNLCYKSLPSSLTRLLLTGHSSEIIKANHRPNRSQSIPHIWIRITLPTHEKQKSLSNKQYISNILQHSDLVKRCKRATSTILHYLCSQNEGENEQIWFQQFKYCTGSARRAGLKSGLFF